MIDVAFVTCVRLPEPDPDEHLFLAAAAERGLRAACWAWDDPAVDWSACRLAIIRSTWNYFSQRPAFVAWAARTATQTRLMNPAPLIEWNTDKRYLAALEARGVAIVPTVFVDRGETVDLGALMDARGWTKAVVKPRVSAGSFDTHAFERAMLAGGELEAFAAARDAMIQPYLRSVDGHGERALVFIDGGFSHSIRKTPRFHGSDELVTKATSVEDAEVAFARSVLATVTALAGAEPLLYARVDIARGEDGAPILMELELTEPSLFFQQSPAGLARFMTALERRLAGLPNTERE